MRNRSHDWLTINHNKWVVDSDCVMAHANIYILLVDEFVSACPLN